MNILDAVLVSWIVELVFFMLLILFAGFGLGWMARGLLD